MHHANLLVGTREWAFSIIPEAELIEGPDIFVTHYERMSIADVRTLIYEAGLRPVVREYRTFVLIVDSVLHEAQNALLKLFEEPNAHTLFFFIIPREDILLPTLRSRFHVLGVQGSEQNQTVFTAWKKLGYSDRLTLIAEKLKEEDSVWLTELLHGLEYYAEQSQKPALIAEVLQTISYIHSPGSSKKMLLEHLALSL